MLKNSVMVTAFLLSLLGTIVFASTQDDRLNELVNQLNGKVCKFEIQGSACVNRPLFASFLRRSDKEQCIIDAAKALGMMEAQANAAVPALIEALNKFRNVDSGDGIIPVRSEIALALGRIGNPSAIKALITVLGSDDSATLSESASVYAGYKLAKGTSYGAVAEALGMFGSQAKEALPELNNLLANGQSDTNDYKRSGIEAVIKKISE